MRWAWSAVAFATAVAVWAALPMFGATALALDHPAWSQDAHSSTAIADSTSWWPPGRRYKWAVGSSPARTETAVDPWGSMADGHWWTAMVLGGLVVSLLWLHRSRLPKVGRSAVGAEPREVAVHRVWRVGAWVLAFVVGVAATVGVLSLGDEGGWLVVGGALLAGSVAFASVLTAADRLGPRIGGPRGVA